MAAPDEIATIWLIPEAGTTPDITNLATAGSMAALYDVSEPYWITFAQAMEAQVSQQNAILAAEFPAFDTSLRPTLTDRIRDIWDGVIDLAWGWRRIKTRQASDVPFTFDVPLAQTYPTQELSFDYEDLYAETARLRSELAAQITLKRGVGPQLIMVDADLMDDMLEDDCDTADIVHRLDGVVQYWPPIKDLPALALSEVQEDGGLPIEISLLAHPAAAHDALVKIVTTQLGGTFRDAPGP